jgi:tetratricopeptide (TPR) repeat protein
VTRENHLKARELFREACSLDPELPEAHIWLARVSAGVVPYGWAEDPALELQEGMQAALKAIYLDDRNPYSHYAFAIVSIFSGQLEQAIRAARKAIELSPSFALGHLGLGMAQLFSGRASEAIAPLEHGIRLSPHDPQHFVWFNMLALARLFTARADEALEAAIRALQVRPDWWMTLEVLTCCYGALDRWDEARTCARDMSKVEKLPGDVLAVLRTKNLDWTAQMQRAVRKASE